MEGHLRKYGEGEGLFGTSGVGMSPGCFLCLSEPAGFQPQHLPPKSLFGKSNAWDFFFFNQHWVHGPCGEDLCKGRHRESLSKEILLHSLSSAGCSPSHLHRALCGTPLSVMVTF